ncbi:MAG: carbamoyltransferase [Bacteroidia bacterium]|nr:carbamoyltransferase [Bacteroidia bacterium]
MYILGLNAYHGDSSAALLKNGELICAFEEERFTRFKHWAGFPALSIKACLDDEKITLADVSYITIGRDPGAHRMKKIKRVLTGKANFSWLLERFKNSRKVASLEEEFKRYFKEVPPDLAGRIVNVEHHRSHLASAFFASPFKEAALLSIDGFGDFSSCMVATGNQSTINVYNQVLFPHSIGVFYTAFTQYLGFPHYGDEYKVMGLAPYGSPSYVNDLRQILKTTNDGLFELNLDYFTHHTEGVKTLILEKNDPSHNRVFSTVMEDKFGKSRQKGEELTQYHRDLAASVQKVTEETIFHLLNHLQQKTGMKEVCIAGGVAQNSVANGKITRNTPFEKVYIPSAGHDAGIAAGSAMYHYHHTLQKERVKPVYSAYTGSHFSNEQIEAFLKEKNIKYTRLSDDELYDKVTDSIINGGVIGWFQGRAEFGPRALGGRSIIADPRRVDAKDLLNSKIKRRESFRPFAPSILKEYVGEFFELTDEVPFMEKVFPIKKEKQALIPAVTHVDGTGRLQSVDAEVSPRYYRLIETFRKKTGIPVLLNTSFNENEPIVNTPAEALDCYLRTKMDILVLQNCIISR